MTDDTAAADFDDALARVFAKVERATKDATNPHLKNKYATLSSVVDACREALVSEGFSWPQPATTRRVDGALEVVVTTQLRRKGRLLESVLPMPVGGKVSAHEIGSAITYGRRYALAAMLGVCSEDDDGNAASEAKARARSKPQQREEQHPPEPEPQEDRLWMDYEAARDAAAKHLRILGPQAHQRILHLAEVQHGNDPNDAEVKRMIDCAEALLLTDPAPSTSKPAAKAEPAPKPESAKATTAKSKATPSAKASTEPAEPRDVQAARKATDSAYRAYQDTCKEEGVAERPWMDIAYHAIGKAWDIKQGSHGVEDYERLAAAYEDEIDRVRKGEGAVT